MSTADEEVTRNIPEAIIVVRNHQKEGKPVLQKGSPEAKGHQAIRSDHSINGVEYVLFLIHTVKYMYCNIMWAIPRGKVSGFRT